MRGGLIVAGAVALVTMSACGGGSSGSSSGGGATTATTPTAVNSTGHATPNGAEAAAVLFNGHYAGTWTNQTFGSTGGTELLVSIDPTSGKVNMTLTLTGNVFGGAAPGPLSFTGQLPSSPGGTVTLSGGNHLFGPYTGTIKSDGSFALTCPTVPSDRVSTFSVTGTVDTKGKGANLTYQVTLVDGSTAHGIATLTKG
jgi:hypothetical protein